MKTTTTRRRCRLATLGAGAALALIPVAAHAATIYTLEYDATGTTHIASTDSTIALGPTTLTTSLDVDTGDFTGSLPLPGTRTEFTVAGFLPVTADVSFIEAAPLEGNIDLAGLNAEVTSTATYDVKLSNIKVFGFPTFAGPFCKTKDPVTIPADTVDGEGFDLLGGGRLVGEYSIGEFEHCGLNTWLINALIPGDGNTVDIEVSNGRLIE